ncbi:deazaflavin-dependent oxidoreductase (nitroreductase family) [Streptosporangium album]|uniref:Deazaflavin-dependent oxidoreductase (Nitroreductase family) n=1 Tax=Streptosporangium album TaxID=47479 RepID=A0A7W7RQE4_9ACTN|nr:nitroreductase family deazaflavin-dependent oxidoreductase [Streptosporangium album]MBB4936275.1 deazaflavin-dependent oxidoreductase (nitroreductase family) [Streptosporangium album]
MPDTLSPFPAFSPDPYVHPVNRPIVTEFRANHGSVGGPFTGADLLLLTTLGARSGRPATSPLAYFRDGERLLVVASAGGSPRHPAWYHNLRSHPEAVIELGDRTLTVHAAVTEGAERDALFEKIIVLAPGYLDYQTTAGRSIPVVALTPTGPATTS